MGFIREIARIFYFYSRRIYYSILLCFKDIYRLVQDHYWDCKLGIHTCYDDKDLDERAAFKDEVIYRPTSYHRIRKMIEYLKLGPEDVFLDLGCGKGRVLAMFSREKLKRVIGVELQKRLVETARKNVGAQGPAPLSRQTPVEIICGDVVNFDPREATVIFLYDPFQYKTFTKVLENIQASLKANPRKLRIVYFDERYADILNAQEWLKPEGEIGHTRILVWTS